MRQRYVGVSVLFLIAVLVASMAALARDNSRSSDRDRRTNRPKAVVVHSGGYSLDGSVAARAIEPLARSEDLSEIEMRESLGKESSVYEPLPPPSQVNDPPTSPLLLVPDSTAKRVMAFDPVTGDLVNANLVPPDDAHLTTPINAVLSPDGESILVSDQIEDVVQKYDLSGVYKGVFAPAEVGIRQSSTTSGESRSAPTVICSSPWTAAPTGTRWPSSMRTGTTWATSSRTDREV